MPVSLKPTAGRFLENAHSRTGKLGKLAQSLRSPTVSAGAIGRQLSLALRVG